MAAARALIVLLIVGLLMVCAGCAQGGGTGAVLPKGVPVVRVRIMQACREVKVAAATPVWARSQADLNPHPVKFPAAPGSIVKLVDGTWDAGGVQLGTGELTLTPSRPVSVSVDGRFYRGRYRLVPVGQDQFDLINDIDVDSYLQGVLPVELYPNWEEEAYKALAIAARTYAIFESRTPSIVRRPYDLDSDVRSQMYKGISAETNRSIRAVDATRGVVVAYGQPGQEKIFKAYYSSCCGGKTQSSYDAFGDGYFPPVAEYERGGTCSISTKYKWGPVAVSKQELSRRFALWAKRKSELTGQPRVELNMQGVQRIERAYLNKIGRPVLFYVTDNANMRYMMKAEDVRQAICTEATPSTMVYSGYFNTVNEKDRIRFVDGRGYGHGVGMCQWCVQRQAQTGWKHEQIVSANYPGTKLIRGY